MLKPNKISFEKAWNTTTEFLIDEEIENAIDSKVESIAKDSIDKRISHKPIKINDVADYLMERKGGLEVILSDLTLSQEKFIRIVSLLRRIRRIGAEFNSEWNFARIKTKIKEDYNFAKEIAKLLIMGAEDRELKRLLPTRNDPYVIIMVSYQETASSGQTNKARDMYRAYERIRERNMRYKEKRVFINFVDGIGWLARKADFKRLVEECHYFLNLRSLDMLESIVKKHVPRGLKSR